MSIFCSTPRSRALVNTVRRVRGWMNASTRANASAFHGKALSPLYVSPPTRASYSLVFLSSKRGNRWKVDSRRKTSGRPRRRRAMRKSSGGSSVKTISRTSSSPTPTSRRWLSGTVSSCAPPTTTSPASEVCVSKIRSREICEAAVFLKTHSLLREKFRFFH